MDELWQRYRSFWRPLLLGLGVFLVGLIVVHILTPDPEETALRMMSEKSRLLSLIEPGDRVSGDLRANTEMFREHTQSLAKALDPALAGAGQLEQGIAQALEAAYLRGGGGGAAFDGDVAAAQEASRDVERLKRDRTTLFRTGNPNVAFSALISDVWGVMRMRANRADMDLNADQLGFGSLNTVTRAEVPRRVLNLALVARIVDVAVRNGARSLDDVRFDEPAIKAGTDAYLQEWPVTVTLTAPTPCIEAILDLLTDPSQPIPVGQVDIHQPHRGKAGLGIVECTLKCYSLAVNPSASLALDTQEEGS